MTGDEDYGELGDAILTDVAKHQDVDSPYPESHGSVAGSQPTAAVTLTVTKGLYSVPLGDTALANMTGACYHDRGSIS